MKKRVLVNVGERESRVAFLEDQDLAALYIEDNNNENRVGNIYKGVVEGVVPGIQAAFVNIGLEKNAFLHFDDVDLDPFIAEALAEAQAKRKRTRRRVQKGPAPDQGFYVRVEDCLKPGTELMVQMTKEAIGTKGARVSANITIPGKYLVLLPGKAGQGGVSKKIEDLKERRRLKRILSKIEEDDCSFIMRTAVVGKSADDIYGDVDNLLDTYDDLLEKLEKQKKAACIYQENDLVDRIVRDSLPEDVHEILVDHKKTGETLKKTLDMYSQRDLAKRVVITERTGNLFEKFNVEQQINGALRRTVPLKCGGSIVIDETEALTAIDVNTGSFVGKKDQERTNLQANIEAAHAVARHLRLRDIGGLIVIDFIDMTTRSAQRKIHQELRSAMMAGGDKFSIGRFSEFGCIEMTRKRQRLSLRKSLTKECPYCGGLGRIRIESQVWRDIKYAVLNLIKKHKSGTFEIVVHPQMSDFLTEQMGDLLWRWEKEFKIQISVRVKKTYHFETYSIIRNGEIAMESATDKIEEFHDVDYMEPSVVIEDEDDMLQGAGRLTKIEADESYDKYEDRGSDDDDEAADDNRRGRGRRGGRGRGARNRDDRDEQSRDDDRRDDKRGRRSKRDDDETEETASERGGNRKGRSKDAADDEEERDGRRGGRGRGGRGRCSRKDEEAPVVDESVDAEVVEEVAAEADSEEQHEAEVIEIQAEDAPDEDAASDDGDSHESSPRPGLYGIVGRLVQSVRRTKRARYEANQEPESHYGWTAMGPAPGRNAPVKRSRQAEEISDAPETKGAEPSILLRGHGSKQAEDEEAKPAPKSRSRRKPAAKSKTKAEKAEEKDADVIDVEEVEAEAPDAPEADAKPARKPRTRKAAAAKSKPASRRSTAKKDDDATDDEKPAAKGRGRGSRKKTDDDADEKPKGRRGGSTRSRAKTKADKAADSDAAPADDEKPKKTTRARRTPARRASK
jgi:ribonuclease G